MTDTRLEPIFIADSVGLDFLNSIATPIDTPVEWLSSGDALMNWLRKAVLVPDDAARALQKGALPGELDAVAAQARALREWFRSFVMAHKGAQLGADIVAELAPLNRVLARDEQFGQVEAGASGAAGPQMTVQRRWRSADALLGPIANAMADVICNEDFTRIKTCEGPNCTLLFADRARAHARRWCAMTVCGNRAKQAAHRERTTRGLK